MISKVPTLAAMTNTSNLANRCPMQDLEIVNFVNEKIVCEQALKCLIFNISSSEKSTLDRVQTGERQKGRQCDEVDFPGSTAQVGTCPARRSGRHRWRSPCRRSRPWCRWGSGSLQAPFPPSKFTFGQTKN